MSIIMPVYNGEKYISEAIESVINQTYTNWELIIVNDGSKDNSLLIAEKYKNEKIKVFSKENNGASAARNYGYRLSTGSLIKFFDADDVINKEMISAQVTLAMANPDCVISGKWGRFYNNDLSNLDLRPEECWKDMESIDWICTSWKEGKSMTQSGIFLIPSTIINNTGLWDESLSLVDDLEFFTKTILASKKVIFSPQSMLYYRSGNENSLAGQQGRKASESCFRSMELSISYLLNKSKSNAALLSAANIWQSFIYHYYPSETDLVKKAEIYLTTLPKPTIKFPATIKTKGLIKIFGWKIIKRLKKYI
ncbi:glycosyltransferase family 2 protein [Pedobacter polaris]|uniref:Glycosyltransferase family 2 protein n=1 Tax=Pedobacter polaris TaxID=2571273 RepID=A0A4U1CNB6_9SPHI|nr:glycosyltransferase family 2 protein [Pedobacter polaris]